MNQQSSESPQKVVDHNQAAKLRTDVAANHDAAAEHHQEAARHHRKAAEYARTAAKYHEAAAKGDSKAREKAHVSDKNVALHAHLASGLGLLAAQAAEPATIGIVYGTRPW
jgi:hypothetical protein